jgi:hypothetical protein
MYISALLAASLVVIKLVSQNNNIIYWLTDADSKQVNFVVINNIANGI